jgi:hypothetical protein
MLDAHALSFFCYVCSNIAHLSRTIKNRAHPCRNLINRYIQNISIRRRVLYQDAPTHEAETHPMVPSGSVNSACVDESELRVVHWSRHALLKKNCSRVAFGRKSNWSGDILEPRLGSVIVRRNHNRKNDGVVIKQTMISTQIGAWKFHTAEAKSPFEPGTNSTYFAIRRKYIPREHEFWYDERWNNDEDREKLWDPEELVFGQFHSFLHFSLPEWLPGDTEHSIGRCTLWAPIKAVHASGLPVINMTVCLIHNKDNSGPDLKTEYVPLNRIETAVAIVPLVEKDNVTVRPDHYIAMALQV